MRDLHWPGEHAFLIDSPPSPMAAKIEPAPRAGPSRLGAAPRAGPSRLGATMAAAKGARISSVPPTTTALGSTPGQSLAQTDGLLSVLKQ
jgi:hypothetical protein